MTTVLAVNREGSSLVWLKGYLEAEGFCVAAARDGPAGLELAWRERPAVILLDLAVPSTRTASPDARRAAARWG